MTMGTSGEGTSSGADDASTSGDDGGACPPGGCLDVAPSTTTGPCDEGQCATCEVPPHVACDSQNDPIKALGLNCGNGEPLVTASFGGSPEASGTLALFGSTNEFAPTEGQRYLVMGSGRVADLVSTGISACSFDLGAYDPGTTLPPPIVPMNVGAQTCTDNPALIGTGDCSNTIQEQFEDSFASFTPGAFDFTELRFTTTVPAGVSSFSFDFAFFSYEYPAYYGSEYNDMFIGWLESSDWTGNISFDDMGNPISLNAGFMDFLDADAFGHPVCPTGTNCSAPALTGTCMQGHGGTRWLSTSAPVTAGDDIEVVFAIMDLGDSVLDSYVFLDNFAWGCEEGPPSTVPID
jgi:hypothetical protein